MDTANKQKRAINPGPALPRYPQPVPAGTALTYLAKKAIPEADFRDQALAYLEAQGSLR
jgi:hypothetical protein